MRRPDNVDQSADRPGLRADRAHEIPEHQIATAPGLICAHAIRLLLTPRPNPDAEVVSLGGLLREKMLPMDDPMPLERHRLGSELRVMTKNRNNSEGIDPLLKRVMMPDHRMSKAEEAVREFQRRKPSSLIEPVGRIEERNPPATVGFIDRRMQYPREQMIANQTAVYNNKGILSCQKRPLCVSEFVSA
jgi:hypothetical protein